MTLSETSRIAIHNTQDSAAAHVPTATVPPLKASGFRLVTAARNRGLALTACRQEASPHLPRVSPAPCARERGNGLGDPAQRLDKPYQNQVAHSQVSPAALAHARSGNHSAKDQPDNRQTIGLAETGPGSQGNSVSSGGAHAERQMPTAFCAQRDGRPLPSYGGYWPRNLSAHHAQAEGGE